LASLNLTTRDATHDLFNQSGRAYPDVSAYGQRFVTIYNGSILILDGTSCSAPTMSGVLTLVNDALIAARRPVLGFLNPWLYAVGHLGFTDVTGGASTGGGTSGFPAIRGWDVASGWGTPVSVIFFGRSTREHWANSR
jgi:tripeptidyl-peptidase-1